MTNTTQDRKKDLARLRLLRESRDVLDKAIHDLSDKLYPEGELTAIFENYETYARELRESGAL